MEGGGVREEGWGGGGGGRDCGRKWGVEGERTQAQRVSWKFTVIIFFAVASNWVGSHGCPPLHHSEVAARVTRVVAVGLQASFSVPFAFLFLRGSTLPLSWVR